MFSIVPRAFAKFVFDAPVIIAISLVRHDAAIPVAADVNHAVGDGKHLARIFTLRVFEPRVRVAKRFAVEQPDDVVLRRDGFAGDVLVAASAARTSRNRIVARQVLVLSTYVLSTN